MGPNHIRAARLYAAGTPWPEIAKTIGVKPNTARQYVSLPGWQELTEYELAEEAKRFLDATVMPGLERLRGLAMGETTSDDKASVQALKLWSTLLVRYTSTKRLETDDNAPQRAHLTATGPGGISVSVNVSGVREAPSCAAGAIPTAGPTPGATPPPGEDSHDKGAKGAES